MSKQPPKRSVEKNNPSGLPRGCGSIQMRGRVYWMLYVDNDGRRIQENTHTDNREEAMRVLALAALPTFESRVEQLKAIAYAPKKTKKAGAGSHGDRHHDLNVREHVGRSAPVRNDAAVGGDGGEATRTGGRN